jgi:AP-4 complex subunit mu-1
MLFNASGYLINSSVDGFIQMKSYLRGQPNLKLSLNSDLVVAGGNNSSANVIIEDCNFH